MTYNMLCSPTFTNDQIKLCNFYLTSIPNDIDQLHMVAFINRVCEIFGVSTNELAHALTNFRLFLNDITCIHCGLKYEIKQPLAYHKLPTSWSDWECEGCRKFLNESFDFKLLLDWYPNSDQTDDDDFVPW